MLLSCTKTFSTPISRNSARQIQVSATKLAGDSDVAYSGEVTISTDDRNRSIFIGGLQQLNGISHTNSRVTPLKRSTTSAAGLRSRVRHIQVKTRRLDVIRAFATVFSVP